MFRFLSLFPRLHFSRHKQSHRPLLLSLSYPPPAQALIGHYHLVYPRSLSFSALAALGSTLVLLNQWGMVTSSPEDTGDNIQSATAMVCVTFSIFGFCTHQTVWTFWTVGPVFALVHTITATARSNFQLRGFVGIESFQLLFQAYQATLCITLLEHMWRSHVLSLVVVEAEDARLRDVLKLLLPPSVIPLVVDGGADNGARFADEADEASVLFMQLCGFDALSRDLEPSALVALLNTVFSTMDELVILAGPSALKIETLGAMYICVSGLPEPCAGHCAALVELG